LTGNRAAILAALAGVAPEVEKNDRSFKEPHQDAIVALHQAQVQKTTEAVRQFVEAAPEEYLFSADLNGHAAVSADGLPSSDQWNVKLSAYRPTR
jgi:hypothetical protein